MVLPEGQGSLSLYIDEPSSRTILPQNTDWSGFTGEFRIEISGLAPILRTINNLSAPIQLDAGNYSVTVTALRNGKPLPNSELDRIFKIIPCHVERFILVSIRTVILCV
ncbi:MAG: hypothetical protein FWC01_04930 [Treponema sp.]|nr:hypothetical protein [Treponema sp.]